MKKETVIIIILILVIVILIGVIGSSYLVGYKNSLVIGGYQSGSQDAVNLIINEVKDKGFVKLISNNETIYLVQLDRTP